MSKLIWVDNILLCKLIRLTKKIKKRPTQYYLFLCAKEYKDELNMNIGDVIFLKNEYKPKLYERFGVIKAFIQNKLYNVIIEVMPHIGIYSKLKIEKLHNSEKK